MRFIVLFAIVSSFAAVRASPAGVEARDDAALAYYPVKIEDGRTSAVEGSPNGLYLYHNETHAAYYGTDTAPSVGSRSLSRCVSHILQTPNAIAYNRSVSLT